MSNNKQTAVEWLFHQLWEEPKDKFTWYAILEKAKEMEKQQKGYSEEDVREMLFMALNEPEQECCITHTKDSIVRKVLKNFKSE